MYSSVLYFQTILWHSVFYCFPTTIRVYFRILKEYPRCALVYSECTLVCYTFRVCSGIVCVSLEYTLLFSNYYQSTFQNTQRIPKMCFSILWVYSSVLYYQIILWHSVSKPWVYSILSLNYYQSMFQNTQGVLKICSSILWVYSSVLYFQSILWHSVNKLWVYSILCSNYYQSIF